MNPYTLLGGVVLWVASVAAAGWWAYGAGQDAEIATQAREDRAAQITRATADRAIAEGLSKIEVRNVTIRQPLETIVRTEQVFRDCHSGPDAVRLLNSTPGVAPAASAAGAGELPAPGAAR